MDSLLDTIGGLPVHPLVVHFAVVLLPLSSFATIVAVYIPRFRRSYGFASVIGVFLGTGATVIAKQSGEALAARIGNPQTHANYGNILPILAGLAFLSTVLWYRSSKRLKSSRADLLGHVTALLNVAVIGLTFLTGHTGAQAVWNGRLPSQQKVELSTSPSSYSKAEVAKHASGKSCWSIVNGNVYDLTKWIGQHPGGPAVIEAICGKDGTASFDSQHMGQQRPENILASYKIGTLG